MKRLLQRFPLLWVVVMFAVLVAAWATLITLAVKNAPEQIDVTQPDSPALRDAAATAPQAPASK